MLERKIPNREGLELGISCLDASLVLVIKLAETYSHLSTARTWGCHYYERTCCLYIVVLAETFVRVNEGDIIWIAFYGIMIIYFDAQSLEACSV
jgi:hypothetical protein